MLIPLALSLDGVMAKTRRVRPYALLPCNLCDSRIRELRHNCCLVSSIASRLSPQPLLLNSSTSCLPDSDRLQVKKRTQQAGAEEAAKAASVGPKTFVFWRGKHGV